MNTDLFTNIYFMRKIYSIILVAFLLVGTFSCSSLKKFSGYVLTEQDAAAAIRQLLNIGASSDGMMNAFSKENMLSAIFPEPVSNVLTTLQQLGLTNEIDRFTNTLSLAAEQTAEKSVPIFAQSISQLKFKDAVRIVKNGGTAATDYLRSTTGDSLRIAVKPVMQQAISEYKLDQQWAKIIKPTSVIGGAKINTDLSNLMAGVVTEMMFRKIEAEERKVRTEASARTTTLLQKVFSKDWN